MAARSVQCTYRKCVRRIETSLAAQPGKLFSIGFPALGRPSTRAEANERLGRRLDADFAQRFVTG